MKFFYLLIVSLLASNSWSQKPELSIIILGNDRISRVNIDQEKFIKSTQPVIELMESEFKDIPKDQMIGLGVTCHTSGMPTIELYSKPQLPAEIQNAFLAKVKAVKIENTKLLDFPMLLTLNSANFTSDFGVEMMNEKRAREYESADLHSKYELNRKWAAEEVLPVLAAYGAITEDKFEGVKNFGTRLRGIKFSEKNDVPTITSANPDYWRAVMEMAPGNQLIPISKVFVLASQGQLDHALKYAEILTFVSDPEALSTDYLSEFNWRMQVLNEQLDKMVNKGIVKHDAGDYNDALRIYDYILKQYPYSAWTLYEQFYSKNALDAKNGNVAADGRADWDAAKVNIYASNPLYQMDVRASNGKEAYLMFRRHEISTLFKDKGQRLQDIYSYADIALDLGVYDFAAQLFWLSVTFDKANSDTALNRYLYCLEKLGVSGLKANFKGDFAKVFKEIEKDKERVMKNNAVYKSLKN